MIPIQNLSDGISITIPHATTSTPGVYLSQVPYTGISSNVTLFLFILGMALWTAGISYFLVRRKALAEQK